MIDPSLFGKIMGKLDFGTGLVDLVINKILRCLKISTFIETFVCAKRQWRT